ncbi:DNA-binding protein [Desulfuribacillus stibiiarsenatis]|uniref:DNA-binding protein n=1 Tax=Desulfuribacillus stibiiarsenatis TaxID=1390249 RepID=A0A1E5L4J8_9FIRM|nr:PPC domain-containing DNA-binding protein [Desulfuribacillus stibiiarsenatis]OEH85018.1 DNA-binding protein [Desulfuribacillus stibiiarsenatis]
MEFRKIDNTYVVRIDKGEEIIETLKKFCTEQNIKLGLVSGLGAVNKATIGLFETGTKKYHSTELTGDFEIASLTGNISTMNGETYLHFHACLSDDKYATYGGHLNAATVSATAEIVIITFNGSVDRAFSEEIGLNLLKF